MKKILILLLAGSFFLGAGAQEADSWKVAHNKQIILEASSENEENNLRTINRVALQKMGFLFLNYTDSDKQKGWTRTIAVVSQNGEELIKRAGHTLRLNNIQLRTMLRNSPTLKIYTWETPDDAATAATIRIRRVHLCTLQLK